MKRNSRLKTNRAYSLVKILAEKLLDQRYVPLEIGLKEGKTGLLLFYYYLYQLNGEKKYLEYSFELLQSICDQVNSGFSLKNIQEQYADLGILISYLKKSQDFCDLLEGYDVFEFIDAIQVTNIENSVKNKDIDIFTGLLCSGNYFLSRIRVNPESRIHLSVIVSSLDEIALKMGDLVCWASTLLHNRVYLGITHGVGSVLLFLKQCQELGIESEKCTELISGGIKFIHSQQYGQRVDRCNFPFFAGYSGQHYNPIELCYGDLGITIAILKSSGHLVDKGMVSIASNVYSLAVGYSMITQEEQMHQDPSVLKGIAGSAMMFLRLQEIQPNKDIAVAYNYWIAKILEYWDPATSIQDYQYFKTDANFVGKNTGFCYGDAGIGLALIEFLTGRSVDYPQLIFF